MNPIDLTIFPHGFPSPSTVHNCEQYSDEHLCAYIFEGLFEIIS